MDHGTATTSDRNRTIAALAAALAATLLWVAPVTAQGFGIYEQGTCAMGRAGAAAAAPCGDGSAIFFNPAALLRLDRTVLSFGGTEIITGGEFRPDDAAPPSELETRAIPVPHAYLAWKPGDNLAVGLGLYAPYGLETSWPLDFEGRFVGYDNALRSVYVQPTVAWRPLERVSIGAGLTVVWSEVELNRRLDLARTPVPSGLGAPPGSTFGDLGIPDGTDFADSRLTGDSDGVEFGGHVAALFDASAGVRLGIRYLFETEVRYDGTADFEQVPTGITLGAGNPLGVPAGTSLDALLSQSGLFGTVLGDQGLQTTITLPDQLVLGVSVDATDRLTLAADYQWTGWSDFDRLVLDFERESTPDEVMQEDFRNTSGIRLGADWAVAPAWSLRGGYFWNQAAAPDETVTPILPEAERNTLTAGLGWRTERFMVDAAYMYLGQQDRRGRVRNPSSGEEPTTLLNEGSYEFDAHLLGLTLSLIL